MSGLTNNMKESQLKPVDQPVRQSHAMDADILITENDAVNYIPLYSVFVLVKHEITMNLPTLHRLSHILVVSSMKSYSKRIWSGFPLSKPGCQSGQK
jgi:hypothetical protein